MRGNSWKKGGAPKDFFQGWTASKEVEGFLEHFQKHDDQMF